jgi:rhodanese-related sulfurtransferase
MKRQWLKYAGVVAAALMLSAPAFAYDREMAEGYAEVFKTVDGPKAGKHLHLMKPDKFVEQVRQGAKVTTVDIRTPGETRFFTSSLPGNRVIPLAELFEHENLSSLPTDGKIVLFCKSGTRASAAAAALRGVGFENTYVLKGGFKALSSYLGPKEANAPIGAKAAAR